MRDPYINLAKKSIKTYLTSGKGIEVPSDIDKDLKDKKAGCFVSLHKGENLRGCIGTPLPAKENLAEELIKNAISACHDPRFEPVTKEELKDLSIKIDILSPLEKTTKNKLDPKKYGVYLKSIDGRSGLLLPDLKEIESVEQQLTICKQKAGIYPEEEIEIYRFEVERHKE